MLSKCVNCSLGRCRGPSYGTWQAELNEDLTDVREKLDFEKKRSKGYEAQLEEKKRLYQRELDLLSSAFYNLGTTFQQQVISGSSGGSKVRSCVGARSLFC